MDGSGSGTRTSCSLKFFHNSGATLNSSNFIYDVNLDGLINVGDTIVVRAASGNGTGVRPVK